MQMSYNSYYYSIYYYIIYIFNSTLSNLRSFYSHIFVYQMYIHLIMALIPLLQCFNTFIKFALIWLQIFELLLLHNFSLLMTQGQGNFTVDQISYFMDLALK